VTAQIPNVLNFVAIFPPGLIARLATEQLECHARESPDAKIPLISKVYYSKRRAAEITQFSTGSRMTPFQTIGIVHSCFKEKFGIPRQPRMIPEATGVLKLLDLPEMRDAVRGLEEFSHLWVIYIFHGHKNVLGPEPADWKSLIRPPRLGGTKKVGVFASRSPHRPNPIGISAVKLDRIDLAATGGIELHLSGLDLLDQTPVIDIKPYVSYADSIPEAETSWATDPPRQLPVEFSPEALSECERIAREEIPGFNQLVKKMIALDPRPAFQAQRGAQGPQTAEQSYAARIHHFDVHWTLQQSQGQEALGNERCRVTRILAL